MESNGNMAAYANPAADQNDELGQVFDNTLFVYQPDAVADANDAMGRKLADRVYDNVLARPALSDFSGKNKRKELLLKALNEYVKNSVIKTFYPAVVDKLANNAEVGKQLCETASIAALSGNPIIRKTRKKATRHRQADLPHGYIDEYLTPSGANGVQLVAFNQPKGMDIEESASLFSGDDLLVDWTAAGKIIEAKNPKTLPCRTRLQR